MMLSNREPYPIIDYLGRPIKLSLFVTYRLRIKNGYILALRRNLPTSVHAASPLPSWRLSK